jgi:uncharacterized protein YndB with AHSA1/START domain
MDKKKFELEYTFNTSPKVLYNRLSTPAGLAEWFADDVNMIGNTYTFIWNGSQEQAEIIQKKDLKFVRYRWIDECQGDCFFEFKIRQDELTGALALIITDFADDEEKDDAIDLWDSQVSELKHALGL